MVTWWKNKNGGPILRQTKNTSKHIAEHLAQFEIGLFRKEGWIVKDHGEKITAEKE